LNAPSTRIENRESTRTPRFEHSTNAARVVDWFDQPRSRQSVAPVETLLPTGVTSTVSCVRAFTCNPSKETVYFPTAVRSILIGWGFELKDWLGAAVYDGSLG